MRIPSDHIDLAPQGYEGYWVEMPRTLKEGFLHEFAKAGRAAMANADEDAEAEASRVSNIMLLELVTSWNLDFDDGSVMPIMSKAKGKTEKQRILAEMPVDLLVYLVQRIAGNVTVPEKTKDF